MGPVNETMCSVAEGFSNQASRRKGKTAVGVLMCIAERGWMPVLKHCSVKPLCDATLVSISSLVAFTDEEALKSRV